VLLSPPGVCQHHSLSLYLHHHHHPTLAHQMARAASRSRKRIRGSDFPEEANDSLALFDEDASGSEEDEEALLSRVASHRKAVKSASKGKSALELSKWDAFAKEHQVAVTGVQALAAQVAQMMRGFGDSQNVPKATVSLVLQDSIAFTRRLMSALQELVEGTTLTLDKLERIVPSTVKAFVRWKRMREKAKGEESPSIGPQGASEEPETLSSDSEDGDESVVEEEEDVDEEEGRKEEEEELDKEREEIMDREGEVDREASAPPTTAASAGDKAESQPESQPEANDMPPELLCVRDGVLLDGWERFLRRLAVEDALTRRLTLEQYEVFSKCRRAFFAKRGRLQAAFGKIVNQASSLKVEPKCLPALGYLAFDRVGLVVETALQCDSGTPATEGQVLLSRLRLPDDPAVPESAYQSALHQLAPLPLELQLLLEHTRARAAARARRQREQEESQRVESSTHQAASVRLGEQAAMFEGLPLSQSPAAPPRPPLLSALAIASPIMKRSSASVSAMSLQ
jgi:hypothetical protein